MLSERTFSGKEAMSTIDKATARVRRWAILTQVTEWAYILVPCVVAIAVHFLAAWSTVTALVVLGTILAVLYSINRACARRFLKACNEHPLIYLVRIKEAFGSLT